MRSVDASGSHVNKMAIGLQGVKHRKLENVIGII